MSHNEKKIFVYKCDRLHNNKIIVLFYISEH